jgi:hypothetical protein
LLPALIALLPLVRWRRFDRPTRWRVALLLASTIGFALLTLPVSRPLWDHVPLLPYIQFPWRFLGPAAFCAALLAAASLIPDTQSLPSNPRSPIPLLQSLSLILLFILGNLGWFYPRHCSPPGEQSVSGMIAWERATDTVGTTAKGEYLPIWADRMPDAEGAGLDAAYAAGEPIVRLPEASLPAGARIVHAEYQPVDAVIELDTPTPFQARYLAFYYPGWRVILDGEPVPIAPTDPDGLISFAVPAGRHIIRIHFGETPLRIFADTVSLGSIIALIAITFHASRFTFHASRITFHVSRTALRFAFCHLVFGIILLTAKPLVLDPVGSPLRRSNLADGHLRQGGASPVTFGDEFVLLGTGPLPRSLPSGDWFEITTYWRALQPGGPNYGVAINVLDAQGHQWQGPETRTPRWHRKPPPVREWPPEQYAIVALSSLLLPGTPPGTYTIEAVAFDRNTLVPLTAHDITGRALGPALVLGQITITPPRQAADPDLADVHHRLDTALGPLTLLGADFDRNQAAPGDSVLLTTLWRADRQPAADLHVRITLLEPDGSPAISFNHAPTADHHPTSAWRPGDVWRGQHFLRLPAGLGDGEHQWTLELGEVDGEEFHPAGEPLALGGLDLDVPERTWQAPPLHIESGTHLGGVVTLLGATFEPETQDLSPGTSLTITLVWRAEKEIDTRYRVFLHLLGPDGTLVAQSDGEPANWSRPTTGWLPAEVVADQRVLVVPDGASAGQYCLQTGMYTQQSGRLPSEDEAGAVSLGRITVSDR